MAFSFQERYDMANASRLNYDVIPDEFKDRIKNTLKRTTNGSLKVNYKQTMKGVGRYYASVANKNGGSCVPIQSMPSIVRNALTASVYRVHPVSRLPMDFQNAWPVASRLARNPESRLRRAPRAAHPRAARMAYIYIT